MFTTIKLNLQHSTTRPNRAATLSWLLASSILFLATNPVCAQNTEPPTSSDDAKKAIEKVVENVKLAGLVEVNAFAGNDFDDNDVSDVQLATALLTLDAKLTDWATAHVAYLWEEDATEPADLDEGSITLGGTEEFPLYFMGGRIYTPFGSFGTNMISDPFTLELAETNQTALRLGYTLNGFDLSAYAYNCDVDKGEPEDKIECFGASLGYSVEEEDYSVNTGVGYSSNMVDASSFHDFIDSSKLELRNYADGMAVYANGNIGPVDLFAEFVSTLGEIEFADSSMDAARAWNIEAGYHIDVMEKDVVLGVAYQHTHNVGGWLPESRILGTVGVTLTENLTAGLEYAHDEDYSATKGGTGNGADTVTGQLALGF